MSDERLWSLEGRDALVWRAPRAHTDRIEMAGLRCALILTYGADDAGRPVLSPHVVWPMLRTIPDDTHASLQKTFGPDALPALTLDGAPADERVVEIRYAGWITITTRTPEGIEIVRDCFPSRTLPAVLVRARVHNAGGVRRRIGIAPVNAEVRTDPEKGVEGAYLLTARSSGHGVAGLDPGRTRRFGVALVGLKAGEPLPSIDIEKEWRARRDYVAALGRTAVFEAPDPQIAAFYRFAKTRAAESVFATRGGLMHGPGGGAYYAAIWANDQAEYANPLFASLGDENASESALNSFRHFARFVNPQYRPIPSSIIAEGRDVWQGAGDRGDQAMIAYGAARYALARGDRATAAELWPLIRWCLEYLERKRTPDGVFASDSDELEGRLPAGDANLNTSALAYDALRSAAYLADDLGEPDGPALRGRADELRAAIERHFGATVQGFPTYRYYAGNTVLRAWICAPLAMGLYDRTAGTIDALFSPQLWTDDGLASVAGDRIFWDRATLYGFRGAIAAGALERALPYLKRYVARRLLGRHVPYAVEAYPEGNQRHLSAESALFCRVVTEGLFGVRPTGLRTFTVRPALPAGWDHMDLKAFRVGGGPVDIAVRRTRGQVRVRVRGAGRTLADRLVTGEPIPVRRPG